MRVANNWNDYSIIDSSCGEKLERWGKYTLIRPDPQIIWKTPKNDPLWKKADGHYIRSREGGGHWEESSSLPDVWRINYKSLTFALKPMGFKHTGLFPEQAVNWDFMSDKIRSAGRPVKVLNLFAYTGGATLACAEAGAAVTHVDASKGMVAWAKENAAISGLGEKPVRYIVDDCAKFVAKETRRKNFYDAVIMDPPSYGRGPGGEIWKLEDEIYDLVELCLSLMSEKPLFFLLNSYTTGLSASVMEYIVASLIGKKFGGVTASDEIGLPVKTSSLILPCGASALWQSKGCL